MLCFIENISKYEKFYKSQKLLALPTGPPETPPHLKWPWERRPHSRRAACKRRGQPGGLLCASPPPRPRVKLQLSNGIFVQTPLCWKLDSVNCNDNVKFSCHFSFLTRADYDLSTFWGVSYWLLYSVRTRLSSGPHIHNWEADKRAIKGTERTRKMYHLANVCELGIPKQN